MASGIDQDQQWLIKCLNATLDTDQQVRSFAETSLNQASLQPGFGSALAKVAANKELPIGLRQLAAVLLKQFISKHWDEHEDGFEHPAVPSDEKEVIRRLLLLCLDDSHRKICTAVSMAVASIAHYDWPEDWPDLLPFLMKLMNDRTNLTGVHGALKCLALVSVDLDDNAMPSIVRLLFPSLLSIVSSPQVYEKSIRVKALAIVYSCISMLGVMSGVYKAETNHLMSEMLHPWTEQFSAILSHPVQVEDPDDWTMRIEVLKCLNQIVQNFPDAAGKGLMTIAGPLWQTLVTCLQVYEQSSVEGAQDSFEGRYDSDGTDTSLDAFVIQLFEFLLTIVGSMRFTEVVTTNLQDLVYYTLGFLQITEQQAQSWSLDANQYIADEDDNISSCRNSGILLLEEIINAFGDKGIAAILDGVRSRFEISQQQKVDGSKVWWRIREAVLYATALLSDHLLETEVPGSDEFDLKKFLQQIVTEDMGSGVNEYPFLHARVLSSVAKFSSVMSPKVVEQFIFASIEAVVGTDVPPPVKVGACRVVSQLLPEAKKDTVQPHIMQLFSSLTGLLKQASEESLHLVLESLQATIKSGQESLSLVEPVLSPIILDAWASHVSDPFISIDAIEVLEAIKNAPGCIEPLVSRVLPYIGPILGKPNQQPDGLVAGCLDLVTMLLKGAPSHVVRGIYGVCFDPVVHVVLQSDDHSEMQNATECLAAFVCSGKHELLAWGGDPGFTMRSLLDALSRLLDPELDSSGSFFVGNFVLQLVLNFPSQMGQHMQDLVSALVRRMQSCKISGLKNSLLLVFARLVHMSTPNVGQFIDLLVNLPAEGIENSFAYIMSEWVTQQGEMQGSYQIKVTSTALALLLSTSHHQLAKINVRGHVIQTTAGIKTRSKAKSAPDQWSVIPLNAKIFSLLADALVEIQEQRTGFEEEDSDWEEVDAGDVEIDQDLLHSATAEFSRPPFNDLAALAKAFENQNDGDEDELLSSVDPLNEINLASYLVDFLSKFYHNDRSQFDQLYQTLTQQQRHAIQVILHC